MSTDQGAAGAAEVSRRSGPTWLDMLISLVAVGVPVLIGIYAAGYMLESFQEKVHERLSEKYGVTVVGPFGAWDNYNGVEGEWAIDGRTYTCALAPETDTLRCDDGTGALVEVGK